MTLKELLKWGENRLLESGVLEFPVDAWRLLEDTFDIDKNYYILNCNENIDNMFDSDEVSKFKSKIEKRCTRLPLQYITGSQEFMGLDFFVNENVLIPRQDTETLVLEVLNRINKDSDILDMCTGSGCIILSICKLSKYNIRATGVDISNKALEVAKKNADNLGIEINYIESNLFDKIDGKYDIIVSNPPYIRTEEIEKLMPEVKEFEPLGALDGQEDDLFFYREIIEKSDEYLKAGGYLFFEIGYDQGLDVYKMMENKGFSELNIVKDLAGLDRVIWGRYR